MANEYECFSNQDATNRIILILLGIALILIGTIYILISGTWLMVEGGGQQNATNQMLYGDNWRCGYISNLTTLDDIRDCYRD